MALLLRIVTKPKWVRPQGMELQDIPADALSDLRTANNRLSVWHIEVDKSNLKAVLIATASKREHLDKLDYALIDEQHLSALSIKCIESEGGTPHYSANSAMHRDLTELTVRKIANLAEMIMPLERVRVPQREVKRMLLGAMNDGTLDKSRMGAKLLSDLQFSS